MWKSLYSYNTASLSVDHMGSYSYRTLLVHTALISRPNASCSPVGTGYFSTCLPGGRWGQYHGSPQHPPLLWNRARLLWDGRGGGHCHDPLNLWALDRVMIPCFSSGLNGSVGGVEGISLSFHSEPTSVGKDQEARWLIWAKTSSRPRIMWPSICYMSLTDAFIDAHTLGSSWQFQPSSFWQLESLVWLSLSRQAWCCLRGSRGVTTSVLDLTRLIGRREVNDIERRAASDAGRSHP